MKTLVLFDTPHGLYSLMLSEMAVPPVEGRNYIFSGKRYEVIEITECLGTRDETGRVKGANEKLMELLTALCGDSNEAIVQLARVTNIGADDGTKKSSGGLIISVGSVVPNDFEHVVFVRCKVNNRKVAARTTNSLAQMLKSFSTGEETPSQE